MSYNSYCSYLLHIFWSYPKLSPHLKGQAESLHYLLDCRTNVISEKRCSLDVSDLYHYNYFYNVSTLVNCVRILIFQ